MGTSAHCQEHHGVRRVSAAGHEEAHRSALSRTRPAAAGNPLGGDDGTGLPRYLAARVGARGGHLQ